MDKNKLDKLLEELQNGNETIFEDFYLLTNKSIFSFVYLIVKQKETAEDIVQETYIRIKKRLFSYQLHTNPSAWIFQIAKNICYDYFKNQENKIPVNIDDVIIEEKRNLQSEKELSLDMHDLMNKWLDDESRQIISLHIVSGYKHREIAKILKLPLGTILWKYNRALKILKEKLKEGKSEK